MRHSRIPLLLIALFLIAPLAHAQTELPNMPGYEQYQWMTQNRGDLVTGGVIANTQWSDDGRFLFYAKGEQHFRVDLRDFSITGISESDRPPTEQAGRRGRGRSAGRALQLTDEPSPDDKWTSYYRDYNVVLVDNETEEEIQVTRTGIERFRYGTACWVYGEELGQNTAMWWAPDSRKLAFYEMDERHCRDFYLTIDHTEVYPDLYVERYPKAGEENPYAGLLIYDLESGETVRVDVGGDLSQYVYNIRFTPDGSELLFNRTNRHQDFLDGSHFFTSVRSGK